MTDEKYEFLQDCRDKKITARSARSTRTHCGKGGAVKFPSDYMSEKEIQSMNGKCESYRMNDPMTWEQFKSMPKDLQIMYIKALRKKYNVPDKNIAEMMGISRPTFCKFIVDLGLGGGKGTGGKRVWDKESFFAWCGKTPEAPVEEDEIPVEIPNVTAEEVYEAAKQCPGYAEKPEVVECSSDNIYIKAEPNYFHEIKPIECSGETNLAIPTNGEMTFQGNVDDILRTISKLLDGRQVRLEVEWEVLG